MVKKKMDVAKVKDYLKFMIPSEPGGKDLKKEEHAESAGDLEGLISKYKKLAAKLQSEDSSGLSEILSQLVKLRGTLSKIHKKKQQQLLDQHWEGIQKKDAQLVEEMRGQLEKSRKSSSEFFLQFEASTTKMKELWQKQHALNVELAAVTQEIASKKEEIINSLYVQEIDDQIDEKINQVLGGDSLNADLIIPKPSFKKCLHNALNDPLCLKEGGGLIGILKQHLYQEFGRCIDSLGIADKSLSNAQDKITKLAHIRDNFISKLADPSSTHFHKLCDEMLVFNRA